MCSATAHRSAAALLLILAGCQEPPQPAASVVQDTLAARIADPVEGGSVALVRMSAEGGRYSFAPAEVRVRPGDVVRFVLSGSQPESVAFDTAGLAPEAAAFVRQRGLLRGVLLTRPGQVYEASFRDAPPGRYSFFSIPHAASGMRGTVVVEPPR